LRADESLLHAETDTKTENNLVPDPHRMACISLPCGEETGTEGHQDGGYVEEWCVVAKLGGSDARDDVTEHERNDQGQRVDARFGRRGALDCLKPHGDPIYHDEESRAEAESIPGRAGNTSLREDSDRDGGVVTLPELDGDEDSNQHTEKDKQCNNATATPGVCRATPLQG